MGSQVSRIDRSRLPGRGTVGKVWIGGRREFTDLGLDLGEREEQVVCHALDDYRRGTLRSGDVSLAIFITSVSGSKSLSSSANRTSTSADYQVLG